MIKLTASISLLLLGLFHNPTELKEYTGKPSKQKQHHTTLDEHITNMCREHRVSEKLVRAIIKQESKNNQLAVSHKGAIGLMQLMPRTAASLNINPYDPYDNVRGGIQYLATLLKRFKQNEYLALAAYNAGPTRVTRDSKNLPRETRNYITAVISNVG